ncbi:MAG TPA: DUF2271 domain-containing protein [Polyangia bacterium]|nr:DUF2271 domain-containing protein [Polyangia bacterium]
MRSPGWLFVVNVVAPVLWLGGCAPAPIEGTVGWNARGMPLPSVEHDAASATGSGDDAAGPGSGGAVGAGGGPAGTGGTDGAGSGGSGPGSGGSSPIPGDAAPPPADAGPAVGGTCRLDVVVTTHNGGGNHAPKNVDAIWIQNSSGGFVKSLYVMARNEIQHLNAWNAATAAAGLSRNRVDAVTGPSLSNYGTRMASWNCTDVNKMLVPAGAYQVCFDFNDGNGTDKHTCDNITLGKTATTVMPPDALPCFTGRVLTFTP